MVNENSKCETWDFKPLNDYLDLLTDYDANGSFADMAANVHTEWGHGYAWYVRATDLEQNLSMADVRYADEYSYKFLEKTSLFGGELLMVKRGEIGKIYFFQMRSKYATLAPNLYLLKLNDGMDSRFLYYYFLSGEGQKKIKTINASTSLGAIYKDDVKKLLVPALDIKEQKRIAETLTGIDSLITKLQELIVKKKNMRQGTMQMLVTGKKRLDGFSGEWITKPLEKLCDLITDGSHESPSEYLDGFYMPSVKDMTDNGFDFSDCKRISKADYERLVANGCKPEIGDVLIAKDGSMLKYVFPVKENRNIVILSSIAILRPKKNMLSSSYLTYYFRQPRFVEQVIKSNQTGTGVPRIVLKNFKKIELRIPEKLNEQEAIAGILSDMDIDILTLEKKLKKLMAIKQGMMEELLTGKVRLM